jgi:peptide chain release factor 3
MKIEQQRGISVTVLGDEFETTDGITFNLLDTPGHEDFSEDTYRTLTAVDSGVMVIDAGQGHRAADAQAVRGLPPAQRADHHLRQQGGPRGRDPFALLDEVADALALDVCPMAWPVGMGGTVRGHCSICHRKRGPAAPKATAANSGSAPGRDGARRRTARRHCRGDRAGAGGLSRIRSRGLSRMAT